MKKTLILTAFLGVMTFAAAQGTTGTSTDATSTGGTSMDMPASTDATSTDATSTDGTSMDMPASTDATSSDGTSMDMSGTSTDATSTDSTSMDMSGTSTDATSTDATSTDGTSMDMPASTDSTSMDMTSNAPAMSPADAYAQAQALAAQADVAYPTPFYDRTLWKQSVDSAFMAHMGDMQNRDYAAYLAQLYTKTQWWINAYNAWKQLGDLTDQEKQWASLSAAKLAYISLMNGNKDMARTYVNQGMSWMDSPSLQAIMKRL